MKKLIVQRNSTLLFGASMLITNILLGTKVLLLSEKIIVVPPEIRIEFWIEGAKVGASYLEQMSVYFAKQMLDMTPHTAGESRNIILRHVSPEYYAELSQKLIEQEKYLKENSITTIFFPKSAKVDEKSNVAEVRGHIKQMVGREIVTEEEHTYALGFKYNGARFLINSFMKVQE